MLGEKLTDLIENNDVENNRPWARIIIPLHAMNNMYINKITLLSSLSPAYVLNNVFNVIHDLMMISEYSFDDCTYDCLQS